MSIFLSRRADVSPQKIQALGRALAQFYMCPPREYYEMADSSAGRYSAEELPFHYDMVQHIVPGMAVLELGCGTAHLCPYVEQRGGTYSGVDYSQDLLGRDRVRHPNARFFNVGEPLDRQFDLVASLYAIEHVVDPVAYLERMWSLCKPGGFLAVICPEFVQSPGLPPSVFYGTTPRRLRDKVKTASLTDAVRHIVDLKIRAPIWKNRILSSPPGSFWMNLLPSVLHGASYTIDADAVHLVGLRDLLWFFGQKGARIVQSSSGMRDVRSEILQFNCYALAKKP